MKFIALYISFIVWARSLEESAVVARNLKSGESDSLCGSCDLDLFYHYADAITTFQGAVFGAPTGCTLAAIRDEESRRGAQYAIPDDKVAITQGFFPTEVYISECLFESEMGVLGNITGCESYYETYFENYEGTSVPSDSMYWDVPDFPFEDGATFVAIGHDGILRPVKSWVAGSLNPFGFDGAVYECCLLTSDVCNVQIPVEETAA